MQRVVELLDHGHPLALALGDLVELVLEDGGEVRVHDVVELLDQHVVDEHAELGRLEAPPVALDVAAILDRDRIGAYVLGRPMPRSSSDLDQRGLGVARRRLGEVLLGDEPHQVEQIARGELGQRLAILVGRLVVVASGAVQAQEAGELEALSRSRGSGTSACSAAWASTSTVVTSKTAEAICDARKRFQIRSYRRNCSGVERARAAASGSRKTEVGRIASWASWASLLRVL